MPRRKTGLVRKFPIQVDCTKEEDELLSRESWPFSKSHRIREKVFGTDDPAIIKKRLMDKRREQKGQPCIYVPRQGGGTC